MKVPFAEVDASHTLIYLIKYLPQILPTYKKNLRELSLG
jgi:hypothetical protein